MTVKNKYAKGTRNEYRSMRWLEEQGYATIRAAGSHGLFDVVGVRQTFVPTKPHTFPPFLFVQVKTNELPGHDETVALKDFKMPTGGGKHIHVWRDRAKVPEVHVL